MPVPNPVMPVKGAGTTLWVYKGNGDPYANPLSDVDWSRLAKVKDLTPGELSAESYDDSYLDDEDADWTATGGQKSAGDTSFTLAWMPGEQGQQALLAWFNEGDTRAYKIRFPNGTVDVFRGWVSSIGKAVTAKEVSDHPHESHQRGTSVDGRRSQHGDGDNRHDGDTRQCFRSERAEHYADRGIPAGGRNRQELPCGVCG